MDHVKTIHILLVFIFGEKFNVKKISTSSRIEMPLILEKQFMVTTDNIDYQKMQHVHKYECRQVDGKEQGWNLILELKIDQYRPQVGSHFTIACHTEDPIESGWIKEPAKTPVVLSGGVCYKYHPIRDDPNHLSEAFVSFAGLQAIFRLPDADMKGLSEHNFDLFLTVSIN